jgi:hypothetical protein
MFKDFYTAFFLTANLTIWGALPSGAVPLNASDYDACVRQQLSILGYDSGSGRGADAGLRAAAKAFVDANHKVPRGVLFLNPPKQNTLRDWCRDLANTQALRQVQPGPGASVVTSDSPQMEKVIRREIDQFSQYLLKHHSVSLAAPIGIAASGNSDAITGFAKSVVQKMDLRYDIRGRAKGRCTNVQGALGEAYRDVTWMCWAPGRGPDRSNNAGLAARYVLVHEYVHLAQHDLAGNSGGGGLFGQSRDSGPSWLVEGHAEWVSYDYASRRGWRNRPTIAQMQKAVDGGYVDLNRFQGGVGMRVSGAYGAGYFAMSVLTQRFGAQASWDYFRRIGQGQKPKRAFQASFGLGLKEYEALFAKLAASKPAMDRFLAGN